MLNNDKSRIFKYLKIKLLEHEDCNYWVRNYFKALIGRTIVCGIPQDGYFENVTIFYHFSYNERNVIYFNQFSWLNLSLTIFSSSRQSEIQS